MRRKARSFSEGYKTPSRKHSAEGHTYGTVVRYLDYMIRRQGYRFRLKPTQTDAAVLRRFAGCSRFVWNELLALNELRYTRGEKRLRYGAMCDYLAYLKDEYPFLGEAHSQPLQQTLRNLDAAYGRALDPKIAAGLPGFKKRGHSIGIRFPQGFRIDGSRVYLPKVGWIGFRKSREIEGAPKNVTVSFDGRHWYVTIQTEREIAGTVHVSNGEVGIDLGVKRFAALSDGSFVEGANALSKYEKRLTFLQRRMSRKRKFSANWRKIKAKVSRLHRKIANVRNDFLHKASTTISKSHALVVLEDLRIPNMTASASGTRKNPGRNVRAKSGLNRRILDQGWGEFRRQLDYKLTWSGGLLILVDARDTSRSCTACGCVSRENRRTQTAFRCIQCGHIANADTNAAINILERGLKTLEGQDNARIACGVSRLRGSMKQEAQLVA